MPPPSIQLSIDWLIPPLSLDATDCRKWSLLCRSRPHSHSSYDPFSADRGHTLTAPMIPSLCRSRPHSHSSYDPFSADRGHTLTAPNKFCLVSKLPLVTSTPIWVTMHNDPMSIGHCISLNWSKWYATKCMVCIPGSQVVSTVHVCIRWQQLTATLWLWLRPIELSVRLRGVHPQAAE